MPIHSFEAVLIRPDGVGTWTYLNIPAEVSVTFASKGQVRLKGTINDFPFCSTALPAGDGSHYLVVGKDIRDHINASQGDTVNVTLELDLDERHVEISDDLALALSSDPRAKAEFDKLAYSHQREYVDWIQGAKKPETRQRRITSMLERLSSGKTLR
jgi:hypothetical protein